jgi:hypothetical protein
MNYLLITYLFNIINIVDFFVNSIKPQNGLTLQVSWKSTYYETEGVGATKVHMPKWMYGDAKGE